MSVAPNPCLTCTHDADDHSYYGCTASVGKRTLEGFKRPLIRTETCACLVKGR